MACGVQRGACSGSYASTRAVSLVESVIESGRLARSTQNRSTWRSQSDRMSAAIGDAVSLRCYSIASISRNRWFDGAVSAMQRLRRTFGSHTYATPPVIPAPKFRPTGPSTTAVPPVMYSQP